MRRFIDIVTGQHTIASDQMSVLLEAKSYEAMMDAPKKLAKEYVASKVAARDAFYREKGKTPSSLPDGDALWLMSDENKVIKSIENDAKKLRADKAVWFTRICRILFTSSLSYQIKTCQISSDVKEKLTSASENLHHKYETEYEKLTGSNEMTSAGYKPANDVLSAIKQIYERLEHYASIPYSKIQNYSFTNQDYIKAFSELNQLEEEFKERAAGNLELQEGDEIVLNLPDDYAWIKLNRAACPAEAKAMGHCGNSPRAGSNERILSLRHKADKIDGVQLWRPCLTFILHADGMLGEMKGRGNEKPAAHYHDQIEALLRLPMITGIRGGGYLQQNNFSLKDMDTEKSDALVTDKPELLHIRERYEKFGMTDSLMKTIADGVRNLGTKFFVDSGWNYDFEKISREDRDKLFAAYPFLMPPKEFYEKHGFTEEFGDRIANSNERDLRLHGFEISMLSDEDRNKLFDQHPKLMTALQYYRKKGLDDTLIEAIAAAVNSNGQRWYSIEDYYARMNGNDGLKLSGGLTPYTMTKEDRRRLWTAHPEIMTVNDEFDMFGMTEDLIEKVKEGLDIKGQEWLEETDFDVKNMSEEDQKKLFAQVPLAQPFLDRFKQHGLTEDFVKDVIEVMYAWSDSGFRFVEFDKDTPNGHCFDVMEFKDVDELIEEYGGSRIKYYHGDEHYGDYDYVEDSDYHVENFSDDLPIQAVLKLTEIAKGYLEDEDEISYLDEDHDWSRVLEILKENDDENFHFIKEAVRTGYESGQSLETYNATVSELKTVSLYYGQLFYTTYERTNARTPGEEIGISFDGPVKFSMTPEEICRFIDDYKQKEGVCLRYAENGNLKDFLENGEIEIPDHNYYGYEEEDAVSRFMEETSSFDDLVKNPYKDKIAKMSKAQLLKAIVSTYKKIPHGMLFKPDMDTFRGLDDEKLREKLTYVTKKYYGYY